MNFYARASVFDIKVASQKERISLLESDFPSYIATITEQLKKEFDSYNDALELVCSTSKIGQKVFNDTYITDNATRAEVETELKNQFLSPFKTNRAFTKQKTVEMFKNVA